VKEISMAQKSRFALFLGKYVAPIQEALEKYLDFDVTLPRAL
jgi:hypothetical protein